MPNPILKIVNVETGEEIERSMTDAEYKNLQNEREAQAILALQEQEQRLVRQSALEKLAALGLTPEEIAAITGA